MKVNIKDIIGIIEQKEISDSSLVESLDLFLNVCSSSWTEPNSKKLVRDEVLTIINDTNYCGSHRKYLSCIYFLKYTSDDGSWTLNDIISQNFFKNMHLIDSEVVQNQIYELIITILSSDLEKADILFDIWESTFIDNSDNFLEFKSFTKMIYFIYYKLFCNSKPNKYLQDYNNKIMKIFLRIYKENQNLYLDKSLIKIEYSQNLLFPLLIKYFHLLGVTIKDEFITSITVLFENMFYFKFSIFTLIIPGLIELVVDSGYNFEKNEIKAMLYEGITNEKQDVRKSTRFILKRIEISTSKRELFNLTDANYNFDNLNSFLCILDCYENFSIHLLKTNWEKFKGLMSSLQNNEREWWVRALIEIGLSHQNLNVQRFISYNTIKFCIEKNDFFPSWLTHELFFQIYLKYIISSLNNKISLQIEELFIKFIYFVLRGRSEWIPEYLTFISDKVLSFTPFRIMIYPLVVGKVDKSDSVNIKSSDFCFQNNSPENSEFNFNFVHKMSEDLTSKYSFEYDYEFEVPIKVQKECFNELMDLFIIIIRRIPIIMRQEMCFLWIRIMLNYFKNYEFDQCELILKLIELLGIIPEYLYSNEIYSLINSLIENKHISVNSLMNSGKLFRGSNNWHLIFQYGIGFGRLKKILSVKSESMLIFEDDITFISSYYNNEEIEEIDVYAKERIKLILINIKLLFYGSNECKDIDIDMLWLNIHVLSLISSKERNNELLNLLFEWCIETLVNIDELFYKIENSIYSLVSLVFIIKCLIHFQKYMDFDSVTLIKVVNNLMIISSCIVSKFTMNNKIIQNWDSYRRSYCQYNIVDVNSINNDKYCIIYSSKLTMGYPDKYLQVVNNTEINRIIQSFPSSLRDLLSTFSNLKFMFIEICFLKYADKLFDPMLTNYFITWNVLSESDSQMVFSQAEGSIWRWFENFLVIILDELENLGTEDFYIWKLVDHSIFHIYENYSMLEKTVITEYLSKIFGLIQRYSNELVDNGAYSNLITEKFNNILTNNIFVSLFEKTDIFDDILKLYYQRILNNSGDTRFFIFPLLNLIYLFIEKCDLYSITSMFEELISNREVFLSKERKNIMKLSNITMELLIFEEKGIIDGCNLRFRKINNTDELEINKIFGLYNKCKIYEDYSSFIRHSTTIFLFNSINCSDGCFNKNQIAFVQLVIFLLTLKLDYSIPISVEKDLASNCVNFNMKNHRDLYKFVESEYFVYKNTNKFPPLSNSMQHKLLINIWQSLCCLIDVLKLSDIKFNSYILEFYFKHLHYLYNPDIRQYLDLFGCNLAILYPNLCIKYLIQGLSNNGNNHIQVIYSLLTISSYLIYYLREKTPFVYNEEIFKDINYANDFFEYKGISWIKLEKRALENYILFFNTFFSYCTSNSSLIRNIVLLALYFMYSDDYISSLVNSLSEVNFFDSLNPNKSIYGIINQALAKNEFEHIIELFEGSKYFFSKDLLNSSFLINSMIIEKSLEVRTVIKNMIENVDTMKMLVNLSIVWKIWRPKKYCSLESIIPQDNIIEFTDQKTSQHFFNTSKAFDRILSALEESKQGDNSEFQELVSFQDRNDEFLLNSHLIFGDLRPSWSLYYLLKKVICKEMSKNYYESPKSREETIGKCSTQTNDYQLKFEPKVTPKLLSEELAPRKFDIFGRDRTELIVIASLVDKIPNIAGLTRTCEVFRVKELLLNTKKVLNDPVFKQISVTAEKWLPISELTPERIGEYINIKKLEGYKIYGLEQTSFSTPLKVVKFPRKSVLIIGKEKEGIPSDIVSAVDQCVEITQFGVIRSLNVHVSASIFIHEYTAQVFK